MTSVSCRTQTESPRLKGRWNANSGTMPGFRSTTARRKSGTGQGSGQLFVTICSSGQTANPTKCGGETPHCRLTSRVSPFWKPLLGIQFEWKPSSPRKLQSTRFFSRGSLRCQICSVRGSCSPCGRRSHAPWRCTKFGGCGQSRRQFEGCGRIRIPCLA